MGLMEEFKPGAEIPTPEGIRFYPCVNCKFYNCEVYLSPELEEIEEIRKIGSVAARAGLELRLRELWDELDQIQREIDFLDRQGFHGEKIETTVEEGAI